MTPRPLIFVSAVSRELRSARQLVANTLTFLGYQPIWQEIFGTESGDLREMLRKQIDQCKGVVQLVGVCYGAEPPAPDEEFGRVSYTQYEALYARKRGKKVWYLFIDESFPKEACEAEPAELQQLQAEYRSRLRADSHLFHSLVSHEALEAGVLKLRDDLTQLRRGVKRWALAVTALLVLVSVGTIWLVQAQHRQGTQVSVIVDRYQKMQQALERLAQVETQAKEPGMKLTPEEQRARAYAVLETELGLPAGSLARELPGFALELYNRSDTTPLMRARAAYALGKFDEAQKLSLEGAAQDVKSYEAAQRVQDERRKSAIESYKLAGQSAQKLIQYDAAMSHFRNAEKLTDHDRQPEEWASLQHEIANLLVAQGKYADAERVFRAVIETRTRVLGPEHPDTLDSRHRLIYPLSRQTKNAQAETEARDVLRLREKVLGPEHADTLVSRYALGEPLVSQGKLGEAETLYRDVIKLDERVFGPEHPRTLAARVGLATVLGDEGKHAEAEPLYREIIRLDEKLYGPEYPNTLNDRMNLATSLQQDHKYAEAEAEYRDVIRMDQRTVGADHPDTLSCRLNLSSLLDDAAKYSEAEAECRQIIAAAEKVLGPENQITLYARGNLSVALLGQGKHEEAQAEYKDVIKIMERVFGLDHPAVLACASMLVEALVRQNKTEQAVELCTQLEADASKALGDANPSTKKFAELRQARAR